VVLVVVVRAVAPGGIRAALQGLLVLLLVDLPLVVPLLADLLLACSLLGELRVGAFLWGLLHFLMLGSWCLLGPASVSE
jgi:hypothetical protein